LGASDLETLARAAELIESALRTAG
jgi:hypothetical protein